MSTSRAVPTRASPWASPPRWSTAPRGGAPRDSNRVISRRPLLLGALVAGAACTEERLITPPPAASLAISPDSAIVLLGDSIFLQAVARDQSGHAFIGVPTAWATSNPVRATGSGTGVA